MQKMFTRKGWYPSIGTGGMGIDFVNKPEYIAEITHAGLLPTMSAVILALGNPEYREKLFGPREQRIIRNRTRFARQKNIEVLLDRIKKMRELNPYGIVAINLMHAVGDYKEMVEAIGNAGEKNEKGEVIGNGIDILVVGAGMPRDLGTDMLRFPHMKYIPIVSSAKAAKFMLLFAKKNKGRLPDGFYIEHPDTAGGHLGKRNVEDSGFDPVQTITELRQIIKDFYGENVHVPVIYGGGVSYREDIDRALEWGYDSVNIGTRALLTKESGMPDDIILTYYLNADKVETNLKSPAGLPSNAIPNPEMSAMDRAKDIVKDCISCIKTCQYLDAAKEALKAGKEKVITESYCIADKLSMTRHGLKGGLLFSGKGLEIIKNDILYRNQKTGEAVIPHIRQMIEFILNPENKRPTITG